MRENIAEMNNDKKLQLTSVFNLITVKDYLFLFCDNLIKKRFSKNTCKSNQYFQIRYRNNEKYFKKIQE